MKQTIMLAGLCAVALACGGGLAAAASSRGTLEQRLDAAEAQAARIAAALQPLEDERAIENLQRSYGFFVDKSLWREAADLFTEDGTLELGGRGLFLGKARVLDYLSGLSRAGAAPGRLFNHIQMQPLVTVAADGTTAYARSRFVAQVAEHGKSAAWGFGTYENEYAKEDGVWKIKRLIGYFRLYTPYADGWAKTAEPNSGPLRHLPPDRPPTVAYDQYPATYIPPYHYRNPVTGKQASP